jgi:hypothetical protein
MHDIGTMSIQSTIKLSGGLHFCNDSPFQMCPKTSSQPIEQYVHGKMKVDINWLFVQYMLGRTV